MKGIIFREFLNMVDKRFGEEITDTIILQSNLLTKGAYTSVGTYDSIELVDLTTQLSKNTPHSFNDLQKEFGVYAFDRFSKMYPLLFTDIDNGFSFLAIVENTIHIEVIKLYPEAELPKIDVVIENNELKLTYSSKRKMVDFAEGLIIGCMIHFNENVSIKRELLREDGSEALFTITRN